MDINTSGGGETASKFRPHALEDIISTIWAFERLCEALALRRVAPGPRTLFATAHHSASHSLGPPNVSINRPEETERDGHVSTSGASDTRLSTRRQDKASQSKEGSRV